MKGIRSLFNKMGRLLPMDSRKELVLPPCFEGGIIERNLPRDAKGQSFVSLAKLLQQPLPALTGFRERQLSKIQPSRVTNESGDRTDGRV